MSLLENLRKIDAELPKPSTLYAEFHDDFSDKIVGSLTYGQSLRLMERGDLVVIGRGVLREIIRQLEHLDRLGNM